jgi:hypothetical protein
MRKTRKQFRMPTLMSIAVIGLAWAPAHADATALFLSDSGVLQISNSVGGLFGLTAAPSCINWGGGSTCGGASHGMAVSGSSNIFAIGAGTITDEPLSGPFVQPFETLAGAGAEAGNTIDFDLVSVVTYGGTALGNCSSNAAFNSCTPANSPITFSEDSTGTELSISFTLTLIGYTGTSASGSTPYIATFSTQLPGNFTGSGACNGLTANITNAVACEAGGGTITDSWSMTELPSAATPEPISLVLVAFGLAGIALFGRRFRRS